jgi:hypothetical protein
VCLGHREWTARKPDPWDFDGAAWRAAVRLRLLPAVQVPDGNDEEDDEMAPPRIIRNARTNEIALPLTHLGQQARWRFKTIEAARDAVAAGIASPYPDGGDPWRNVSEELFDLLPPAPGSPPIE